MKRIWLIFGLLALISCASTRAQACTCAGESAPCQQYWEAAAVFIGTVIEGNLVTVKEGEFEFQRRAVRISVDEAFRGVEGAEVEVMTGLGDSDCGFGFRRSQQYLVYAFRSQTDQKLHTSICTRTRAISEAATDLNYIRALSKARRGGTISGEVARYLRNSEGGLANQPLPGVTVTIDGPEKYEAVTDAKGVFRIEGIKPGEYTVVPAAATGLATRGPDRKVEVADRGCAVVYLWLESNARISGRVLNPEGLPVPKAEIFLIDAEKEKYRGHWDAAYADENGAYTFKLIPPGTYVLQIRYDGMTSQNRPFPVMYYPGTADKSQAQIFAIKEGETIDLDLKVPPLPTESEIRGQVVWPDGKPAATAKVGYMVTGESILYAVEVDEQGRFTLSVYNGLTVGFRASVEVAKHKYVHRDSGQIVAGADTGPIKIILPSP